MFARPIVYFDIVTIDSQQNQNKMGRIEMELFADIVPQTAKNFKSLCTHEKGYGYKGSVFDRIIPGFMCQGGTIIQENGTHAHSIWGEQFPDENFELTHDGPGILSMVNNGRNTNGTQFFITTASRNDIKHLDGKNVVFGKIINGLDNIKKIELLQDGIKAMIKDCGELLSGSMQQSESKTLIKNGAITNKNNNPIVYFDIINQDRRTKKVKYMGRIVMILFADIAPKTAEDFRKLCTEDQGYIGGVFEQIISGFITIDNITGVQYHDEETSKSKHNGPGILSMTRSQTTKNGLRFFISTQTSCLDDKQVVFGSVIKGMDIVRAIRQIGTRSGWILKQITIAGCGQLQ